MIFIRTQRWPKRKQPPHQTLFYRRFMHLMAPYKNQTATPEPPHITLLKAAYTDLADGLLKLGYGASPEEARESVAYRRRIELLRAIYTVITPYLWR